MIRWRALFDDLRIPWFDRGANTARGHISIACPWCGRADPSHHLAINESSGAYRCYRSGGQHRGYSTPYLLLALGVSSTQIDTLLRQYSDTPPPTRLQRFAPSTPAAWDRFQSAAEMPAALDYLRKRGFEGPELVARQYDLRASNVGRYGWRVLMPLRIGQGIAGFTGRAIRPNMAPNYLTDAPEHALYVPVLPDDNTETLVIVEGPFDALKITHAYSDHRVVAIAILGLSLGEGKIVQIARLARDVARILFVVDSDQSLLISRRLRDSLAAMPGLPYPERVAVPDDVKDAAEMSFMAIRRWLTEHLSQGHQWPATDRSSSPANSVPNGGRHI